MKPRVKILVGVFKGKTGVLVRNRCVKLDNLPNTDVLVYERDEYEIIIETEEPTTPKKKRKTKKKGE